MDFGKGQSRLPLHRAGSNTNLVATPEHHLMAVDFAEYCSARLIPIVSFMDTQRDGAKKLTQIIRRTAYLPNHRREQHSRPTSESFYVGYSGGAIPLAASNLILSLRDGVFRVYLPMGLATLLDD